MFRTFAEWVLILNHLGILWIHDGKPERPHVILPSGLHRGVLFDAGILALGYPALAQELCSDFVAVRVRPLLSEGISPDSKAVGPGGDIAGITVVSDIAAALDIGCCFTTVVSGKSSARSVQVDGTFSVRGGVLLPVECVMDTPGSITETILAVEQKGAVVPQLLIALCNWSGIKTVSGRTIVAMFDKHMPSWDPPDCPLCKKGSKAIRPKDGENWALLNASY